MPKFFYSGDVNIQYGGLFYSLSDWYYDFATAYRVTPVSDMGGPDNQFIIEGLTLNGFDDAKRIECALSCIGANDEYSKATKAQKRHILVNAFIAYGYYDIDSSENLQIGKADSFFSNNSTRDALKIDTFLRGGSSLRNYVKREYLQTN